MCASKSLTVAFATLTFIRSRTSGAPLTIPWSQGESMFLAHLLQRHTAALPLICLVGKLCPWCFWCLSKCRTLQLVAVTNDLHSLSGD